MRSRGFALCCLGIGIVIGMNMPVGSALAADTEEAGKTAFTANKCNLCHAVKSAGISATTESEKMKGPDLTSVVAKAGIEESRKWVMRETKREGKQHKKEYKGTPADLDAILSWLATQK